MQMLTLHSNSFGTVICDQENHCFRLIDYTTGFYTVPFPESSASQLAEESKKAIPSFEGTKIKSENKDWEYQDCKWISDKNFICSAKTGSLWLSGEIHLVSIDDAGVAHIQHIVKVPNVNAEGEFVTGIRERPLSFNAMDFEIIWN